jgi:hypothetical protein
MFTRDRLFSLALTVLAAPPLAVSAAAQCIGPDGLSAGCCAPVSASFAQYPAISVPGTGICWTNCAPTTVPNLKVALASPFSTSCGEFTSAISVTDPGGTLLLSGALTLDYTRTWGESVAPGVVDTQVWRFAAKGDLRSAAPLPFVCPVPTCIAAVQTAFFYGYVDFAFSCATGVWESAVVLYHACDQFIHTPGFSDKPGVFHPGTSYAIVAPDSSANPFVPVVSLPPAGPVMGEGMRPSGSLLAPGACTSEEFVSSGSSTPLVFGCACPFSPTPIQHSANKLVGTGSCPPPYTPGSFASLNLISAGLPWIDMITTSIGSWTGSGAYPGPESAFVNEGLFSYHDACSLAAGLPGDYFDIFYGGSTTGGYPVISLDPTIALSDKFIDIASNFSLIAGTPPVPPFYGSVGKTDHLIYVNTP